MVTPSQILSPQGFVASRPADRVAAWLVHLHSAHTWLLASWGMSASGVLRRRSSATARAVARTFARWGDQTQFQIILFTTLEALKEQLP